MDLVKLEQNLLPARLSGAFNIPVEVHGGGPAVSTPPSQAELPTSNLPSVAGSGHMWLAPLMAPEALHPMLQSHPGAMQWPSPFPYLTPYMPPSTAVTPAGKPLADLAILPQERSVPAPVPPHISMAYTAAPSATGTAAASVPGEHCSKLD
jgi:hypothetical protein